ncbi:hypothetical protein SMQE30_11400 [Serratia marcescens]|nr:hypothetical protein SMQE30_11400 [Serratia marcescens]
MAVTVLIMVAGTIALEIQVVMQLHMQAGPQALQLES